MQLLDINKAQYRARLNVVIVACIAGLTASSLAISQTLIHLLPSESGSHFHWNALGVVVSAALLGITLLNLKTHPKMKEVVYVWELKHALNLIYRKNRQLLEHAKQGNAQAMLALQFSYDGSRQLWKLDDNTITMDSLHKSQAQLDIWAREYGVELDIRQYHSKILKAF
ncbi:DUF3087 domain-containing protein [Vibrio sp. B1Z05]|uniref:DUF3087 domain-containing protein n=1 Tax=Vibrio sp. B1Z05 TaxID=2654980 RepID=UPI00128C5D9B|nr:DUF3087 domain-containing protein [Vibrio sp. B1Z05]MPW36413.1 DUF3087 family protein [Vibrio sp. B1Z05]